MPWQDWQENVTRKNILIMFILQKKRSLFNYNIINGGCFIKEKRNVHVNIILQYKYI